MEPEALVEAFERMVLIREFEQEIHRLFLKGSPRHHPPVGRSGGGAGGRVLALEPSDFAAGTYRGHGHALAKGTDPEPLAAEMLGRATGWWGAGPAP